MGLTALVFFILAFAVNIVAGKNKEDPAGPYVLVIHSLRDLNENYKEYANWTMKVTKMSKKGPPVIQGSLEFFKPTKNLECEMEVWKKDSSVGQGDNWKKYNNDFMKFGSVCTNPIMIIFFKQFQGISWDWSCTFKAQNVKLKPIDVNEKLHMIVDEAEYGTFKTDMKYWSKDPTLPKDKEPKYVIRFEIIVSVKRAP